MAWFKKARKPIAAPDKASRVPEGLWVKCPECDAIIYTRDLVKSLSVCTKCGHHFRLTARERLLSLFDGEHWVEHDANLRSNDPLTFTDTKPYRERLTSGRAATGLPDAVIVGVGRIDGIEAVVAAMEYAFIGGSMGVVMGEKIRARGRNGARPPPAADHRVVLGRRANDGRRAVADADGEGLSGAGPPRSRGLALRVGPDRPDDRRRDGELCHAGRRQHRRAEGAHRLRRARASSSRPSARSCPKDSSAASS